MASTYESFHIIGAPAGAIIRELSERDLTTITCFRLPDGALVHTESRIEFEHDVFGWTSFSYKQHGDERRVQVARDDSFPPGCVPSYAEWMVIHGMIAAGQTRLRFTILDESDADLRPNPAELSATSQPGILDKSGSTVPTTGQVVMQVNGAVRNRHWLSGTTLVASDWSGAVSHSEATLTDALVGLDSEVQVILHGHVRSLRERL